MTDISPQLIDTSASTNKMVESPIPSSTIRKYYSYISEYRHIILTSFWLYSTCKCFF